MDRKTFIKKATSAMLIGIPIYSILSCSYSVDDPIPDGADKNCLLNGTATRIGSNHGHSMTVSLSDVDAGVEKQYNIQGTSSHPHTVTVSENNFAFLKSNQQIQVASTIDDGHAHFVTISCA